MVVGGIQLLLSLNPTRVMVVLLLGLWLLLGWGHFLLFLGINGLFWCWGVLPVITLSQHIYSYGCFVVGVVVVVGL